MPSPKVFGIAFKEHRIQFFSETVDVKILEGLLLPLVENCFQVTEADGDRCSETHVPDGVPFQGDRIVKEAGIEENARKAIPSEHDPIGLFRIRAAGLRRTCPAEKNVIIRQGTLGGEHLFPPVIDLRNL